MQAGIHKLKNNQNKLLDVHISKNNQFRASVIYTMRLKHNVYYYNALHCINQYQGSAAIT